MYDYGWKVHATGLVLGLGLANPFANSSAGVERNPIHSVEILYRRAHVRRLLYSGVTRHSFSV